LSIAINYPFTLLSDGTTEATEDYAKIYVDRLLTLISTNIGQRPMLPTYGTDIFKALFENDNKVEKAIISAITSAVALWLPEISISAIDIGLPDQNGISTVLIEITLPNSTITTVNVSSALIYSDGRVEKR
jgi:phage baseplate assembly protein W